MKIFTLAISCLLLSFFAYSQESATLIKSQKANRTLKIYKPASEVVLSLSEVKEWTNLLSDGKWIQKEEFVDDLGITNFIYEQQHNHVPVFGSRYIVRLKNNQVHNITGNGFENISVNNSIVISDLDATTSAKFNVNSELYAWQSSSFIKSIGAEKSATLVPNPKLVIIPLNDGKEFKYAYKLNIFSLEPMEHWNMFIDAETGEIITKYNLIHTQEGTAQTKYSGTRTITTEVQSNTFFRLRDSTRGKGIHVWNANENFNNNNLTEFEDDDNDWNNVNANQDEVATDAFWAMEEFYDMLNDTFNRNSIDNNGEELIGFVHFGSNYSNASWNGFNISLGDGGNGTSPYTSVDVIGHELTHGLTHRTSNLIYQRESGGLNEAFSDIMGQALEYYAKPEDFNWKMGNEFEDDNSGIRDMENPKDHFQPDTYEGEFWITADESCQPSQQNDRCGVHINSGVANYWYYLLCEGGTGINDNEDNYQVDSIGLVKATQVAYRTFTNYLSEFDGYHETVQFSLQACIDIFGKDSPEYIAIQNAWHAVGLGNRYGATPNAKLDFNERSFCVLPSTFTVQNKTIGADSSYWDFGAGEGLLLNNDSEINYQYENTGTYTITLVACNSIGCDTLLKNNFVSIGNVNVKEATCIPQTGFDHPTTGIYNVQFGQINNSSGAAVSEGYVDFSCVSTRINPDLQVPITIITDSNSSVYVRVWIDINNNQLFESHELLFSSDDKKLTHSGFILIPSDSVITDSFLRMRVASAFSFGNNNPNDACRNINRGQAEDYSVGIGFPASINNNNSTVYVVKLFPNPAKNNITIQVKNQYSYSLRVFNILGDLVHSSDNFKGSQTLNTQEFTPGFYSIQLVSKNQQITTAKFIKQ